MNLKYQIVRVAIFGACFRMYIYDQLLKAFTTEIAVSRIDSIAQETANDIDVVIYMDGSKINSGGVGTLAVMFKKGHKTPSNCLCFYISNANQHTLHWPWFGPQASGPRFGPGLNSRSGVQVLTSGRLRPP